MCNNEAMKNIVNVNVLNLSLILIIPFLLYFILYYSYMLKILTYLLASCCCFVENLVLFFIKTLGRVELIILEINTFNCQGYAPPYFDN